MRSAANRCQLVFFFRLLRWSVLVRCEESQRTRINGGLQPVLFRARRAMKSGPPVAPTKKRDKLAATVRSPRDGLLHHDIAIVWHENSASRKDSHAIAEAYMYHVKAECVRVRVSLAFVIVCEQGSSRRAMRRCYLELA